MRYRGGKGLDQVGFARAGRPMQHDQRRLTGIPFGRKCFRQILDGEAGPAIFRGPHEAGECQSGSRHDCRRLLARNVAT